MIPRAGFGSVYSTLKLAMTPSWFPIKMYKKRVKASVTNLVLVFASINWPAIPRTKSMTHSKKFCHPLGTPDVMFLVLIITTINTRTAVKTVISMTGISNVIPKNSKVGE